MKFWYESAPTKMTFLLLPFSWMFRAAVAFRYFLYRIRFKKTVRFPVPVIVIGNITVGGTGKTPLVIWLANFLKSKGFKPGIVSRGVGGQKQKLPLWIEKNSDVNSVGDEAILIARRTELPFVVCVDRVAAVEELLNKSDCNIVIADDGLQHYRLGRDVEIAVIDGERDLGNGQMLPAGPLREPSSRLKHADFIVRQGKALKDEYGMQLKGEILVALHDKNQVVPLEKWRGKIAHVFAAIGNPDRFFSVLRKMGLNIIPHAFPDHYHYRAEDFKFNDAVPIIMTEKDAVKCEAFADERFWYLPVEALVDERLGEEMLRRIRDYFSA